MQKGESSRPRPRPRRKGRDGGEGKRKRQRQEEEQQQQRKTLREWIDEHDMGLEHLELGGKYGEALGLYITLDDFMAFKAQLKHDDDDDDDDDDVGGGGGGDNGRGVNLLVKVESHANCHNCKYKTMEALPSTEFVDYNFDSNDLFSAITTKDYDEKSCDKVAEKREFDLPKFQAFCDNFGSNVPASTTNGENWSTLPQQLCGGDESACEASTT